MDLSSILQTIADATKDHSGINTIPPGVVSQPAPQPQPMPDDRTLPVGGVAPNVAPTAVQPKAGLMDVVKGLLAPEAGSFWAAAATNPNGLMGAKTAQAEWRQKQIENQHTNLMGVGGEQEEAEKLKHLGESVVGDSIVNRDAPGGPKTVYTAPNSQEALFAHYQSMPDGPDKVRFGEMLRGAQYDPVLMAKIIDLQTGGKLQVQGAKNAGAKAVAGIRIGGAYRNATLKPPAGWSYVK